FYEVLVFDAKIAACREALGGSPRAAIERALSRPHDYLACECCDRVEVQLAASQPTTALVYQLYLESGAVVNVQDMWNSFQAVMEEQEENELLALFYRALAKLKYLGMIKNSRKRADDLRKLMWKGL
ncbi:uncharacterized protein K441DRAFT_562430, partial [Cenococcum geophilum 1.58]|uniref:uncharacterized protein n=1 Tax=Cenococcum geophilum 1.58 TaxID=794803 RepID=UPI00358E2473